MHACISIWHKVDLWAYNMGKKLSVWRYQTVSVWQVFFHCVTWSSPPCRSALPFLKPLWHLMFCVSVSINEVWNLHILFASGLWLDPVKVIKRSIIGVYLMTCSHHLPMNNHWKHSATALTALIKSQFSPDTSLQGICLLHNLLSLTQRPMAVKLLLRGEWQEWHCEYFPPAFTGLHLSGLSAYKMQSSPDQNFCPEHKSNTVRLRIQTSHSFSNRKGFHSSWGTQTLLTWLNIQ